MTFPTAARETIVKPADLDFAYVRRGTLVPMLSALVAAGVLAFSILLDSDRQARYGELGNQQGAIQQDYNDLVLRRRLVDRYHARYAEYHDLGFVGQESRLDWIETLRQTTDSLTLPRLSYAIAPQLDVIAPVQSFNAGENIAVNVSRLELDMALLHEIDLLEFIDELQHEAPGLIRVPGCSMLWEHDGFEALSTGANIRALCSVEIFSVITSDVGAELTVAQQ